MSACKWPWPFRSRRRRRSDTAHPRRCPKKYVEVLSLQEPANVTAGVVIIEHDFIRLLAERTHGHDGRAGIETIRGEEIQLVEIAVVLVHLLEDAALQAPVVRIRQRPAVAAVHENDFAGQHALPLLSRMKWMMPKDLSRAANRKTLPGHFPARPNPA